MLNRNNIQKVIDEVVDRIVNQHGLNQEPSMTDTRMVEARVITTAQVPNGLVNGVVTVRHDAVITPAAQDLLCDRAVTVKRLTQAASAKNQQCVSGRLVLVGQKTDVPVVVKRLLGEADAFECVFKASAQAAKVCQTQERIVMFTGQPERAVIALGRYPGVRPVEVASLQEPTHIERRCESTSANVLVIPSGLGRHWQIKRVVEKFLAQSYTMVPEGL